MSPHCAKPGNQAVIRRSPQSPEGYHNGKHYERARSPATGLTRLYSVVAAGTADAAVSLDTSALCTLRSAAGMLSLDPQVPLFQRLSIL